MEGVEPGVGEPAGRRGADREIRTDATPQLPSRTHKYSKAGRVRHHESEARPSAASPDSWPKRLGEDSSPMSSCSSYYSDMAPRPLSSAAGAAQLAGAPGRGGSAGAAGRSAAAGSAEDAGVGAVGNLASAHALRFLQLVLPAFNREMEAWDARLSSSGSMDSVNVYNWMSMSVLQLLQRYVVQPGVASSQPADSAGAAAGVPVDPEAVEHARAALETLDVPIVRVELQPTPFPLDSKAIWANSAMVRHLGFRSQAELNHSLNTADGLRRLYDDRNIDGAVRLLLGAVASRRNCDSMASVWRRSDGIVVEAVDAFAFEYDDATGLPLHFTVARVVGAAGARCAASAAGAANIADVAGSAAAAAMTSGAPLVPEGRYWGDDPMRGWAGTGDGDSLGTSSSQQWTSRFSFDVSPADTARCPAVAPCLAAVQAEGGSRRADGDGRLGPPVGLRVEVDSNNGSPQAVTTPIPVHQQIVNVMGWLSPPGRATRHSAPRQ